MHMIGTLLYQYVMVMYLIYTVDNDMNDLSLSYFFIIFILVLFIFKIGPFHELTKQSMCVLV